MTFVALVVTVWRRRRQGKRVSKCMSDAAAAAEWSRLGADGVKVGCAAVGVWCVPGYTYQTNVCSNTYS